MHGKEKKHDAFARLREWLENGDQALDREMEEGLYDEAAPLEPAADDREFITTRRKRSAITQKKQPPEKTSEHTETRRSIRRRRVVPPGRSGGMHQPDRAAALRSHADAAVRQCGHAGGPRKHSLLRDAYHGRNRRNDYCDRDHPGLSGI